MLYFSFAQHLNLSNYMVLRKPCCFVGVVVGSTIIHSSPLLCFLLFVQNFLSSFICEASCSLINMTKRIWIVWSNFLEFPFGKTHDETPCLLKKGFWQISSLSSLLLSISITRASHFSRVVSILADSTSGAVSRIITQPCTNHQH